MFATDGPVDKKWARHELMSKADRTSWRAKIWFNRPAFGKYEGRRTKDDRSESDTDVREGV